MGLVQFTAWQVTCQKVDGQTGLSPIRSKSVDSAKLFERLIA